MLFFVLYLICVTFQIIYWIYFYLPFLKFTKNLPKTKDNTPPVSVILAAKNEANNLKKNLEKILTQVYPEFEVLVADDYSTDDTLLVLNNFKLQYSNLGVVHSSQFADRPGKKAALTAAISKAKYDILLFTDADCFPTSNSWIKKMAGYFSSDKHIVLGYGPYIAESTLLNKFICYETCLTAISYFSFALAGMPYMGVGRNMAYRKGLFIKAKGFEKHKNITSGDDDLFINQVATKKNVAICLDKETWCFSKAKNTLKTYFQQKNRHVSTAVAYRLPIQLLLSLYALSHFLIYFFLFFLTFYEHLLVISVFIYFTRALIQYYLYHYKFIFLGEKRLRCFILLFDVVFLGYYFLNLPGTFSKRNKWR